MAVHSMIHTVQPPGLLAWCLLVLLALPAPAAAQQAADLARRVEKLERDTSVLNQQVFRGQAPSIAPTSTVPGSAAVAGLEVRVQQLEANLAQATGQMEELSYRMARLQDALNKLTGDVEFRFQELEKAAKAAPANTALSAPSQAVAPPSAGSTPAAPIAAPSPVSKPASTAVAPAVPAARPSTIADQTLGSLPAARQGNAASSNDPQQLYNDAIERLQSSDYAGAEALLQTLIKGHPNHPLLSNAQYWVGETFYARKDYRQAAVAFAQGYQAYPNGNKAPDSLLKLGQSLAAMNKKTDACLTFDRLLSEYKTISSTLRGLVQRQQERLGC